MPKKLIPLGDVRRRFPVWVSETAIRACARPKEGIDEPIDTKHPDRERVYPIAPCQFLDFIVVTRDPKDDYLLAHATIGRCDFLVTGDRDLLDIQKIDRLSIITPGEFAEIC